MFGGLDQSGGESSLVAQLVELEENDTQAMQTIRDPPVITINKSAAYALYAITYIRVSLFAFPPERGRVWFPTNCCCTLYVCVL